MSCKLCLSLISIISSFCCVAFPSAALGQYVVQTAFCEDVVDNKCIRAIPNQATVKIKGRKTVFFWANIRSTEESAIRIYMLREGACYDEDVVLPEEKLRESPGYIKTAVEYIRSLTIQDIGRALGVGLKEGVSGEIGGSAGVGRAGIAEAKLNAKVNFVIVPSADRFRVHDFRYLDCAGTLRARIFDSNGQALPGNNETKAIRLR